MKTLLTICKFSYCNISNNLVTLQMKLYFDLSNYSIFNDEILFNNKKYTKNFKFYKTTSITPKNAH